MSGPTIRQSWHHHLKRCMQQSAIDHQQVWLTARVQQAQLVI